VRTFTGQAFRGNAAVKPLLVLASETVLMLPVEAWKFSEATPHFAADGMLQARRSNTAADALRSLERRRCFSAQVSVRRVAQWDERTECIAEPSAATQRDAWLADCFRAVSSTLEPLSAILKD
jgi:hypothetical protein